MRDDITSPQIIDGLSVPAGDSRVLASTLAGHEWAMIEEGTRASGGRVYGPGGAAARQVARSTFESIRRLGINKTRFRAHRATP
jgi:formate hydrogenlyase transcriptional activator